MKLFHTQIIFFLGIIFCLTIFQHIIIPTVESTTIPFPHSNSSNPSQQWPFKPFQSQQATKRGKCVPIPTPKLADPATGYNIPTCYKALASSRYTHFWVTEDIIPQPITPDQPQQQSTTNNNGENNFTSQQDQDPFSSTCISDAYYSYTKGAQQLMNVMTGDEPTVRCQSILILMACFVSIPVCDPEVDIDEYVTRDINKPCPWVCELFRDNLNEICIPSDVQYLAQFGFDLTYRALMPQFDCNNLDYYSSHEAEDMTPPQCVAPTHVDLVPQATGRCETYSGSLCREVVGGNTQIYVPGGAEQSEVEQALYTYSMLLNALPKTEFQTNQIEPNTCVSDTITINCAAMFRECVEYGIRAAPRNQTTGLPIESASFPTKIALPLTTPLSTCEQYKNQCTSTPFFQTVLALNGKPTIANCDTDAIINPSKCYTTERTVEASVSTTYNYNQKSYIPKYGYQGMMFDGPGGIFVLYGNTFASQTPQQTSYVPYSDCPAPLVEANQGDMTIFGSDDLPSRCTFSCPSPVYTDKDRSNILTASRVLVIIALICSVILCLTFLIFKSQRHKRITLWFMVSYFGAIFMLFLALLVREQGKSVWDVQCATKSRYSHMTGFGLFQAMFLHFFIIATCAWWMMQAVDLFQRLILGLTFPRGKTHSTHRMIAQHLFCWGLSLICVLATIIANQYGYDQYLYFSFISFDPNVSVNDENGLGTVHMAIYFFMLPILLCIIAGFIFIGIILVYLIRYNNEGIKKFQDKIEQSKSFWFKFQQVIKLLGFSILIIPLLVLMIVHVTTISKHQVEWANAKVAWGQDLVLSFMNTNLLTGLPTSSLSSRLSPGSSIAVVVGFCTVGYLSFLLYIVLSTDIIALWLGLFYFKCGCTCCKRWAKEDTTTGSDGSASSHGSSGHSNDSSSAGSTRSNKSAQTAVSNDLFSGQGAALTTRARQTIYQQEQQQQNSKDHSNSDTPSKPTSQPPVARKGALFKGMTTSTQDHRRPSSLEMGSLHTSPSNSDIHSHMDGNDEQREVHVIQEEEEDNE